MPQDFLGIISIITQHAQKHQYELLLHRIRISFLADCQKKLVQNHQCWISWETCHIFLFLGPGIHWLFFNFWCYSRKCWQKELKLLWYSWNAKKKKWNHLLPRLGPRGSAPASAPPLGPRLCSRWFQFILFLHFMKPPKFQFFCQHFRETTNN